MFVLLIYTFEINLIKSNQNVLFSLPSLTMRWRFLPLPLLLSSLLLSLLSLLVEGDSGFRICAYNVDNFNLAKASQSGVLHTLTRVGHTHTHTHTHTATQTEAYTPSSEKLKRPVPNVCNIIDF